MPDHELTEDEKALREWFHDNKFGGHWWMVIKSGFRRSRRLTLEDLHDRLNEAQADLHVVRYPHLVGASPWDRDASIRLGGKIEGVNLALSYIEEELRG